MKYINYFLAFIFILTIWQISTMLKLLDEAQLPSPLKIYETAEYMFLSEGLLQDITSSLWRVAKGFSIGLILGVLFAITPFYLNISVIFIENVLGLFRPIPPIAWIPISILWFGYGDGASIFIVFLGAFFPIFTNVFDKVRDLDEVSILTMKSFGASRLDIIKDLIVMESLPNILSGAKVGIGVAWMSVIAAEMVGAQSGLGYIIQASRMNTQIDKIIVGMLLIGLLGLLMTSLIERIKQSAVTWK